MLWTLIVIIVVLWVVGMVTAHTLGGLIHLLLVAGFLTVLVRVLVGNRAF